MARKCKFDPQWEQALSLLSSTDAQKAREIIEYYQATGEKPANLEARFEMILLLVQPTIDRRRTAAARARERRQRLKKSSSTQQTPRRETSPTEAPEQVKLQPSPAQPIQPVPLAQPTPSVQTTPSVSSAPRRSSLAEQAMKHRRKQIIAQSNKRRFDNKKHRAPVKKALKNSVFLQS